MKIFTAMQIYSNHYYKFYTRSDRSRRKYSSIHYKIFEHKMDVQSFSKISIGSR